jgi:hypothetical protein
MGDNHDRVQQSVRVLVPVEPPSAASARPSVPSSPWPLGQAGRSSSSRSESPSGIAMVAAGARSGGGGGRGAAACPARHAAALPGEHATALAPHRRRMRPLAAAKNGEGGDLKDSERRQGEREGSEATRAGGELSRPVTQSEI